MNVSKGKAGKVRELGRIAKPNQLENSGSTRGTRTTLAASTRSIGSIRSVGLTEVGYFLESLPCFPGTYKE